MAWQTNPTFADGNVLSAAQLNILSENCEYLFSLVSGINVPFTGDQITTGNTRGYTFTRQSRYLHYKARLTAGDSDGTSIKIDTYTEGGDSTNRASPYTWTEVIDLTTITSAPAVGDEYEVIVYFTPNPTGTFHLDYLIESDSATL